LLLQLLNSGGAVLTRIISLDELGVSGNATRGRHYRHKFVGVAGEHMHVPFPLFREAWTWLSAIDQTGEIFAPLLVFKGKSLNTELARACWLTPLRQKGRPLSRRVPMHLSWLGARQVALSPSRSGLTTSPT